MNVTLFASPNRDVVAESTISLTLIASNTSPQSVRGASIGVPVPYGAAYVEGSLFRDAVRISSDEFLGDGYEIAELEPAARTAFMWKLRVEATEEPLRIVPQVFAGVTRVRGAEPLEIPRSSEPRDLASVYREFEGAARAYFEEIFDQPAPASLQQALFACALACALDAERKDATLELQAQALHRLAKAVRGHHVTGVDPNFLMELQGLRDARIAAATIEGLRAFAALDVAARRFDLAADERVRDTMPFV